MALGKWIGGILGWIITGNVLGAMAGYFIGSLFESDADGATGTNRQDTNGYDEGARNSFLFSMLVLAAYIIKADGKIMHSEMETVRRFLRQNFGEVAVREGEAILLRLFEEQKKQGTYAFEETIRKACIEMRLNMDYSTRLQLMSFLAMIARADGKVSREELDALRRVGSYLQIDAADVESVINMNYSSGQGGSQGGNRQNVSSADELARAYKILGILPTATDEEVKKAYRKMALKHHPDRVATLGEDVKRNAEKKFQEINNAKAIIDKARGRQK